MRSLRPRRQGLAFPVLLTAGAAIGVTGFASLLGQGLAYISLVFGVLFFAYAARYYLAIFSVLIAPSVNASNGKNGGNQPANGNTPNAYPMISVHVALYNEERVVDRLLTACSKLDYPNYEVVVVDDSNDGTVKALKEWILKQLQITKPRVRVIHRERRSGFKGGALNEALRNTSPRAEFVTVFDADFVPPPDILKKFLAYFNRHSLNGSGNGNASARYSNGKLGAVQGYQWHTLNRAENWLTKGISCEFSGNYMVDRTFQEVTGVMKMVAGSVYMIRADLLRRYGWSNSITEDWELTLRLYEDGHKVLYTPLIQAPGECPSTLGKLVKQRMRWAEGHTYNVRKHFLPILLSTRIGVREKLEFLYFAPYYLQSAFLILGTFFWFSSDVVLGTRLSFWTQTFGWALVFSNLLALPLMSLTGLFFEKRARKDFSGIFSLFLLTYALSPYQAFASLKGLLEPIEGSWVRTFKSGKLAGFPGRLEPRRVIKDVLPPRRFSAAKLPRLPYMVALGLSLLLVAAFAQGALGASNAPKPAYYFYNQPAPSSYSPFSAQAGLSFLMHLSPPNGQDASAAIGSAQGSGPVFFSDAAPNDIPLPFGASVSIHIWVDAGGSGNSGSGSSSNPLWSTTTQTQSHTQKTTQTQTCTGQQSTDQDTVLSRRQTCTQTQTQTQTHSQTTLTQTHTTQTQTRTTNQAEGNLKFRIDFYDPASNSVIQIPGVGDTEVFELQSGVNFYEASWGNFAQNKVLPKGDTLVVSIWCPDCETAPILLFNSPSHPSNIDFPIMVPENSLSLAAFALIIPAIAGLVADFSKGKGRGEGRDTGEGGLRRVQRTVIIAAAIVLLSLPLVITFNSFLTSIAVYTGFDRLVTSVVPYEAGAVADLLRGFGIQAGNSASSVWLGGGVVPVIAFIDWNCAGWQGFVLFGMTSLAGLGEVEKNRKKAAVLAVGILGIFAVNVLRILIVVLLGYYVGFPVALIFHDYGGTILTLVWLLFYWTMVLKRNSGSEEATLETS